MKTSAGETSKTTPKELHSLLAADKEQIMAFGTAAGAASAEGLLCLKVQSGPNLHTPVFQKL
jgi:hypothetical protein